MKVELGTLKNKGDDLVAFLEPRVGTKPELSGGAIEIEDAGIRQGVRPRHVKTYIKRFLYMNGVKKNYRVFVSGSELTIQEIELGKEEKEKEEKEVKEVEKKEEVEEETKMEAEEEAAPEPEPEKMEEAEKPPEEPKAEKPKKAGTRKPRKKKED